MARLFTDPGKGKEQGCASLALPVLGWSVSLCCRTAAPRPVLVLQRSALVAKESKDIFSAILFLDRNEKEPKEYQLRRGQLGRICVCSKVGGEGWGAEDGCQKTASWGL